MLYIINLINYFIIDCFVVSIFYLMKKLKVLISGETINLSKPTLEFAKKSKWYSWLNDASITQYLSSEYKKNQYPN